MRVIIPILLLSARTFAQSTITYYDKYGNETNKAKITQDVSPYKPLEFPEYQSSVPSMDLIMLATEKRQKLYDERRGIVKKQIYEVINIIKEIPESEIRRECFADLTKLVNKLNKGTFDYSQNSVYNSVINTLDEIKIKATNINSVTKSEEPSFSQYKYLLGNNLGNAHAYIGVSTEYATKNLSMMENYKVSLTSKGLVHITFDLDNWVSLALRFDKNNKCKWVFIVVPISFREEVINELSILYNRESSNKWNDKINNRTWETEVINSEGDTIEIITITELK